MPDPRFHRQAEPMRLARIAEISGADLAPGVDPDRVITDVAPLATAGSTEISFASGREQASTLGQSGAGACIVGSALADRAPDGMALLIASAPTRAYAKVAAAFHPARTPAAGADPRAHVDPSATLGEGASVAAGAVVGAGVAIGANSRIGANAVIGDNVSIGAECVIAANVTIECALIGDRVTVQPGAVIGARGFGFDMSDFPYQDVPQLGRVVIEDDVEIGANSTIDRGTLADTLIGQGTKIDNLVMVGHNVRTGRGCVLVSQSGVAGSTTLDDFVVLAAKAGVAGHLHLGKGAQIAAASGVMRDVAPGAKVGGLPAIPLKDFFKLVTMWQRQLKGK